MRVKMSKQPAPTASTVGPCPTVIQIVGRPGTGSLPSTITPPDHPLLHIGIGFIAHNTHVLGRMVVEGQLVEATEFWPFGMQ